MSTLTDDMIDIIQRRPGTSFAELQRVLNERGHDVTGDLEILFEDLNVVFWQGVSASWVTAIQEVKTSRRAHMHPLMSDMEAFIVYGADGGMLALPFARRLPKSGYKEHHWFPAVWYVGSNVQCARCRQNGWV